MYLLLWFTFYPFIGLLFYGSGELCSMVKDYTGWNYIQPDEEKDDEQNMVGSHFMLLYEDCPSLCLQSFILIVVGENTALHQAATPFISFLLILVSNIKNRGVRIIFIIELFMIFIILILTTQMLYQMDVRPNWIKKIETFKDTAWNFRL